MIILVLLTTKLLGVLTQDACCTEKTVGGVDYRLTQEGDTSGYGCLNDCMYERVDDPGQLFCFKAGNLDVVCGDGDLGSGFGTTPYKGGVEPVSVESVSCKKLKQSFPLPTNSTPLLQIDTPYKQVDASRPAADMFSDAIEAKDNENAFDLSLNGLIHNTQAGMVNAGNSLTWPILQGKGLSIVQLKAPPCSVGLPHYHGVDEISYVSSGANVVVGIKEFDKPLNMMKNVKAGTVVFLPKLSIHFFINLNCNETLEGVQIFASDRVTTTAIGAGSMSLPSEILQAAYNTDIDLIEIFKNTKLEVPEVNRLDPFCLKRCGLL